METIETIETIKMKKKTHISQKTKLSAACVILNGKFEVLLGKRISKHGNGEWQLPGGKYENGELLFETAIRETKEETNLSLFGVKFVTMMDSFHYDGTYYITFYFKGFCSNENELINMEPKKCEGWKWFSIDNLPYPIYELETIQLEKILKSE